MKQTAFLRCFLTQKKSSSGLNHLTEKTTVLASLTYVCCGRPRTAHCQPNCRDVHRK